LIKRFQEDFSVQVMQLRRENITSWFFKNACTYVNSFLKKIFSWLHSANVCVHM
jgi:hypothetical protein